MPKMALINTKVPKSVNTAAYTDITANKATKVATLTSAFEQ